MVVRTDKKPLHQSDKENIRSAKFATAAIFEVVCQRAAPDNCNLTVTSPPDAPDQIIRLREVMRRTGLCRSAVYLLIKNQLFPRQRKIGGKRSVGWSNREVQDYIRTKLAGGEQHIEKDKRGAR
jgi:prophage regulatory protein